MGDPGDAMEEDDIDDDDQPRVVYADAEREGRVEALWGGEGEGSSGLTADKLKEAFTGEANDLFGSGWCWLVRDSAGALHIRQTSNADTPVVRGEVPLLTCDVWEHAYYVDYRNERGDYVDAFWKAIQWDFAARCFAEPRGIEEAILNP